MVLVTGVTGYIGSRLVPRLLEEGFGVRVLLRGNTSRLDSRTWKYQVEIAPGDVLEPGTLSGAMQSIDAAYYLIHSMGGHTEFSDRDIAAAKNFSSAAATAGVKRIIYLGGLGDPESDLSEHLQSRQQTGDSLRQSSVPVTEFRAGMVVGSGSLSFEMLRNLTERLPIMIAPRWVYTRSQPIAVRDVLDYLVAALQTPASEGQIIEIGTQEATTYAEMMMTYARIRNLRRFIFRVPVLTPRLSSYWVHWMTPVSAKVARPLIEGLRNELVVRDQSAGNIFPTIRPLEFSTAVHQALVPIETGDLESLWSDAIASNQGITKPMHLTFEQGMFIECRQKRVDANPATVFQTFSGFGGDHGWPPNDFLWRIRGAVDRIFGGVGMRRTQQKPDHLMIGDALDFWRVEIVKPNQLLRLRSEMKVPGQAWLQFEAINRKEGKTDLVQTSYFAPKGLLGLLYWYASLPIHRLVFSRMFETIVQNVIRTDQ